MPHDTLPRCLLGAGNVGEDQRLKRQKAEGGLPAEQGGSELGGQEGGASSEPTYQGLGRASTLLERGGDVLKMLALPRLA